MKRSVFRQVVVFALLGAAATVLVAWGCALLANWDSSSGDHRAGKSFVPAGNPWAVTIRSNVGRVRVESKVWMGFTGRYHVPFTSEELVPEWGRVSSIPSLTFSEDAGSLEIVDEASGWPRLALWSGWGTMAASSGAVTPTTDELTWGIAIRSSRGSVGSGLAIPLHPIWPGFAIDTALYGAGLWVLWLMSGAGRRFVRRRRGLCVGCGYDLRGHAGWKPAPQGRAACPECGAITVPSRSSQEQSPGVSE
jgi:hypothetical protein